MRVCVKETEREKENVKKSEREKNKLCIKEVKIDRKRREKKG